MTDPSTDPVGTVRMTPGDIKVAIVKTVATRLPWRRLDYTLESGSAFENLGGFHNDQVADFPVIGAVPGTPAAEQGEPASNVYADLTARLAAADLGWSHEHGDPPANPEYIKRLAFQVMAFQPPLIAGVYVDEAMLNRMRDRLHGDRCGCGEWDSHSQEYVDSMDATIHAVLWPLRPAALRSTVEGDSHG